MTFFCKKKHICFAFFSHFAHFFKFAFYWGKRSFAVEVCFFCMTLSLGSHAGLPSTLHQALQTHRFPEAVISLIGTYLPQFQGLVQAQTESETDCPTTCSFDSMYRAQIPPPDLTSGTLHRDKLTYFFRLFLYRIVPPNSRPTSWLLCERKDPITSRPEWTLLWNSGHRLLIMGFWSSIHHKNKDETSIHIYALEEHSEKPLRQSLDQSEHKWTFQGKAYAFLPHPDDEARGFWFVLCTKDFWLGYDPKQGWKTMCLSNTSSWWTPSQYPYAPFLQGPLCTPPLFVEDIFFSRRLKTVVSPALGIYLLSRPWCIVRKGPLDRQTWSLPRNWEYLFPNALGEYVFYVRFNNEISEWWLVDPIACTKRRFYPRDLEYSNNVLRECTQSTWAKGEYCHADPAWGLVIPQNLLSVMTYFIK